MCQKTEKLRFEFVKSNYDELLKRLPTRCGSDAGTELPCVAGQACDDASRQKFVGSSKSAPKKFTGGHHTYDEVLESMCLFFAKQ